MKAKPSPITFAVWFVLAVVIVMGAIRAFGGPAKPWHGPVPAGQRR